MLTTTPRSWQRHTVRCAAVMLFLSCATQVHASYVMLNYNGATAMVWNSGLVMQQSNLVIGVIDVNNNGFAPPSTNQANNYVGSGDAASINTETPPAIGYDQTTFIPTVLARGAVRGILEYSGSATLTGLFRAFSSSSVTASAYYADGGIGVLSATPASEQQNAGSWTVNTVNPAYSFPNGFTAAQTNSSYIGGTVYGLVGGNNNLTNSDVKVVWRYADGTTWNDLDLTVAADGSFYADPGVFSTTTVYVRVVGVAAGTAGVNYPFSASSGPITVVPEPMAMLGVCLAAVLLQRRTRP